MKFHSWGIILGLVVFMSIAILIDWTRVFNKVGTSPEGISSSFVEGSIKYRTCPAGESFSGPLIPDQENKGSERELGDIKPDDKLPVDALSDRAGFGLSSATDPEYWARLLGSGWFIDWTVRQAAPFNSLEHWQMIRVNEDCISPSIKEIQLSASLYPRQVWIIGNEPDVIWQDNVTAERYAVIYHDLYALIKASDPTALLAVAGVSQATSLRLQYLDLVLQTYQTIYHTSMPVDWWTIHGYVLREEKDSWGVDIPPGMDSTQGELREVSDHGRIDLFEAQIRSFRLWMTDQGYQNTPLALTEFGILMPSSYGFPSGFISNYLNRAFTWLSQAQDRAIGYPGDEYHLVQKWAWFSISDPIYTSSDLGDLTSGNLTPLGESFREAVSSMIP